MRRKREDGIRESVVLYYGFRLCSRFDQCDRFQARKKGDNADADADKTRPDEGNGNGASETGLLSQTPTLVAFIAPRLSISPPSLLSPWCWPPPSHHLLFIPSHLSIHLHPWLSLACPFLLFPYPLPPRMILLSSPSLLLILNLLLPPFRKTTIGRLFSALLLSSRPVFFGSLLLCVQPILYLSEKVLTVVSSRHFSHPREKEMPV